jgi:hypothetical protein
VSDDPNVIWNDYVSGKHGASSMCNEYPIRRKPSLFMAQIVVPLDLTQQEAARLCSFIMTLAQPDDAHTRADLEEMISDYQEKLRALV